MRSLGQATIDPRREPNGALLRLTWRRLDDTALVVCNLGGCARLRWSSKRTDRGGRVLGKVEERVGCVEVGVVEFLTT